MADRKDFLVGTFPALNASSATQIGRTIKLSNCDKVTLSVTVTVTAATLQATLALTGTNDEARAADGVTSLPAIRGALISDVPLTVTYSTTTGLLTFNNLDIGTQEVVLSFANFPRWARPVWTFTSGGGTVAVSAYVGGWST